MAGFIIWTVILLHCDRSAKIGMTMGLVPATWEKIDLQGIGPISFNKEDGGGVLLFVPCLFVCMIISLGNS